MRFAPPEQANVVKHEDKSEKLIGFISEQIAATAARNKPLPIEMRMIARSAESPVARALGVLKADLRRAGVELAVIFAQADTDGGHGVWAAGASDMPCVKSLWFARNARLIDAHEVLTIGTHALWIGDSMRRDPEKRDSFETYVPNCTGTAAQFRRSFDRIAGLSEMVALSAYFSSGLIFPSGKNETSVVLPLST